MDWGFVHKTWDKWASTNIGPRLPLKAALLVNFDPTIHENWFSARCINTSKPAGEGAIVMQTAAYILVALYEGSIGPASCAMAAADQLTAQLGRKNL
uniref:Profilin n=1 Tax=Medicago truncatula TaxID=3880 RepID=B7FMZ4_MEDTR|nr:unknown [Medicago truncatula]AFK45715.1 unknown [Medicago truncatula]